MQLPGTASIIALLLGLTITAEAQDAHRWEARTRGLAILPQESSSPPGSRIHVEPGWTVEAGFGYGITSLLAVELDVAVSSHNLFTEASSDGSMHLVLPTLLLQLHPLAGHRFDPYIGAGGNVTWFYLLTGDWSNYDFTSSVGWAVQGGFDYGLGNRVALNLDVRYVSMSTDLKSGGSTASTLEVDPVIVGVGVGYQF